MEVAVVEALEASHRPRRVTGPAALTVYTETLEYETSQAPGFTDITDTVCEVVGRSGVEFGTASVFSRHTTAAIKINENEPLLLRDMARVLRQAAPQNAYYEHNDFSRRTVNMNPDECANGHSHCQHLFLGTSETIPLQGGRLVIGRYQRLFLIELDHPRLRQVIVTVMGAAAPGTDTLDD